MYPRHLGFVYVFVCYIRGRGDELYVDVFVYQINHGIKCTCTYIFISSNIALSEHMDVLKIR